MPPVVVTSPVVSPVVEVVTSEVTPVVGPEVSPPVDVSPLSLAEPLVVPELALVEAPVDENDAPLSLSEPLSDAVAPSLS
jgi:hypothetical protein